MSVTKLEVWEWLMENGAINVSDTAKIAEALEADKDVVKACLHDLLDTGHVSLGLERDWQPNPTDELSPSVSPFGAGGGPVSGEKPANEPPERYR